jgi:fatty-acid desaturase
MKKGLFFAHMGWLLRPKDPQLVTEGARMVVTDMERDPVLSFQRKFNWLLTPYMCYLLPGKTCPTQLPSSGGTLPPTGEFACVWV